MNGLHIARARMRLHSPEPITAERLAAWEAEFAAQDGDALASRWVQPDEWLLIRRLPLRARWRADEADVDVGHVWRTALDHAIATAVARNDGNCLRYRDRREALADLVYRSALRDATRQWAWLRMGLIPRPDLAPDDALRYALREIERQPELAWPVLRRLLDAEPDTAAFTAALRALGGSLVPQLLALSPRSAPYLKALKTLRAHAEVPGDRPALDEAESPRPVAAWPGTAIALIGWARSRAAMARRYREPLAVLLAALVRPAPGALADALTADLTRALAQIVVPAGGAASVTASPSPASAARVASLGAPSGVVEPAPPTTSTPIAPLPGLPDLPALPELPAVASGQPTAWGGALFWLPRLGAAWLKLDPPIELAPLLRQTALALGLPDDDAALAAFCGGEVPGGEAPTSTTEYAQAWVAGWEAWLRDAAPELPEPRVAAVCQRRGRLVIEPGWVSLHLPLNSVDTAVRRLGLDLDPGWLPWLGCVVRICYDDA